MTHQSPARQDPSMVHLVRRQSRRAVRQRFQKLEVGQQETDDDEQGDVHRLADVGFLSRSPSGRDARDRDRIVERVAAEQEVEHDADDETREDVRGEVVVEEQLARHGEERQVVIQPRDEEEPSRVVEAVSNR